MQSSNQVHYFQSLQSFQIERYIHISFSLKDIRVCSQPFLRKYGHPVISDNFQVAYFDNSHFFSKKEVGLLLKGNKSR